MAELVEFSESDNVGEWLTGIVKREKATGPTILVAYRGQWWQFCIRYLKDLSLLYPKIKDFGGSVIILTSDKLEGVKKLENLDCFDYAVSDPSHKMNQFLRDSNLPNSIITGAHGDAGYTEGKFLAYANGKGHTGGLLQPSVLVLDKDMKTLFEWKIDPKVNNKLGAVDRPDLSPIIQLIEDKVNGKVKPYEVTNVEELSKLTKVEQLYV